MTTAQAEAVERSLTTAEARLWLEMVAFLAAPPAGRERQDYEAARKLGISPEREAEMLDAAWEIVCS